MSKRNIKLYLDDIKDAIGKIEKYSKNLSFNKFSKNNLVIDAIVRNLEVIGEAAKNISVKFKDEYKDILVLDYIKFLLRSSKFFLLYYKKELSIFQNIFLDHKHKI